jgi:cytoskeletal protein RodZ
MGLLSNHALHASTGRLLHEGSSSTPTFRAYSKPFIIGLALLLFAVLILLVDRTAGAPKQAANSSALQINHSVSSSSNPLNSNNGTTSSNSTAQSNSSASSNVSASVNSSDSGHSSAKVTVNGQDIPVPQNGSTQQTVTSPDGSTTNVSVSQSTSGNGQATNANSTNTSLNVQSFSSSLDSSSTDSNVNVQEEGP